MQRAQITGDPELEILKEKRGKTAGPGDDEHADEVDRMKAKLAGNEAANETKTPNVLKTKSVERGASSTSAPADDELEILKAKRAKAAAPGDGQRLDQVETSKAKLAGKSAAPEDTTTTRNALDTKSVARDARRKTLPKKAAGVESARRRRHLPNKAAGEEPARRRQSAFDLAFVVVLGLWGIALVIALMTGAQWWLFVLCTAATAGALLFGLLDSLRVEDDFGRR